MNETMEVKATRFMIALCSHLNTWLPHRGAWRLSRHVFSPIITLHKHGQAEADLKIWPDYLTHHSIKLVVGLPPDELRCSGLECLEAHFHNEPDPHGKWGFDRFFVRSSNWLVQTNPQIPHFVKWPSFTAR